MACKPRRIFFKELWIKHEEFHKNIYFCIIDYAVVFVWITTNCGKFWKRWEYQTTLPASWEICMQVKKQQLESKDWFQIGKGVHQGCILSPSLFNFSAEYIMWNSGLDEAQAGIKLAGRNINNLRYADDNHPYGRKWRGIKEPLDEGERGEAKS